MRFSTILSRAALPSAAVLALGVNGALALEAEAFAERLKQAFDAQPLTFEYGGATLEGSNVTLSDVKIGVEGASTPLAVDEMTFENVTEDEGGYRAERMVRSDVKGDLPDFGENSKASYSIASWGIEGLVLPSENAEGNVAVLSSTGIVYDRMFIDDAQLVVDGNPFVTLASAEATVDIDASPMGFGGDVTDLKVDLTLPPDPSGELKAWVEGTGYETIEVDMKLEGSWAPDTGVLDMPTYQFAFADMGTLDMNLNIGGYTPAFIEQLQNVQKQMSSGDEQAQQAAGMQMLGLVSQLTFGGFALGYDDEGAANRLLDYYAETNGQTKDELVQQTVGILPLVLGQLGAPDLQAQIQEAVTTFLNDPKSIRVSLEPDTPVAFPALMGAAMSSPAALAQALNAKVMANQ